MRRLCPLVQLSQTCYIEDVELTHALTKEVAIPKSDLTRALIRKAAFEANPAAHTYAEELPNG